MNNLSAILVTSVAVGALVCDVRRDIRRLISARTASLFTLGSWFLLEAVQVPDALNEFTQSEYDYAVTFVFLALVAFIVGYSVSRGRLFDGIANRVPVLDSPQLLWRVCLVALFIGIFPLVLVSGFDLWLIIRSGFESSARWSGPFQRGRYGGALDAVLELQMFLNAAVPLAAVFVCDRRASKLRRWVCGLFLLWMGSRVVLGGARSALMSVLLPCAAVIYWKLNPRRQRMALLVGVPLLCIGGYVWSAASVVTRNSGDFRWSAAEDADYIGFEMFRELTYLASNVPDKMDHQFGMTYLVQVVNPIPRFLWPSKPVGDAGLLLARARGAIDPVTGEPTMTQSPGLIGEMYWNFGLPGVIGLSALWGWLARCWDRIPAIAGSSTVGFVIYSAGLAIIFVSGRSFSMPALYGMLSFVVLLYFMTRGLGRGAGVRDGAGLVRVG